MNDLGPLSLENIVREKIKDGFKYLGKGPSTEKSKDELGELKSVVFKILSSVKPKQSIINRVTNYWIKTPLWLKLLIGIVLVVPLIALGIIFNIVSFILMGIYVGTLFTASWYFISEHSKEVIFEKNEIDVLVSPSIEKVNNALNKLDSLSGDFLDELGILQLRKKELETSVSEVTKQRENSEKLLTDLQKIECGLNDDVMNFSERINSLNKKRDLQVVLFDENKTKIKQVNQERAIKEKQLRKEIEDLNSLNEELASTNNTLDAFIQQTKTISVALVDQTNLDKQKKTILKEKLEKFATEKENILEESNKLQDKSLEILRETKKTSEEIKAYKDKFQALYNQMAEKMGITNGSSNIANLVDFNIFNKPPIEHNPIDNKPSNTFKG